MAENFQNFYVTKLREACDAVATTIYVDTVPSITEGTLVIEYANSTKHEIIHFTGVSGYGLTGCTRGLEGTTAQSHSAGVDVRQNLTAGMIDKIINGVITTENIADGAVTADKIDFTTLTQDISNPNNAYIQIGTLLICYGQFNATGIGTQAYAEKTFNFTFPKAFSSRPQVYAAVDDIGGYCGEYVVVNVATTTTGKIVIGHTASTSSTSCRCGWLAIGAA